MSKSIFIALKKRPIDTETIEKFVSKISRNLEEMGQAEIPSNIIGKMVNLAEPRLGSKVIFKTDDFFASAHRILKSESPVFKEGLFDKNGKWMDGWETRRRRCKCFDWVFIKVGKSGIALF